MAESFGSPEAAFLASGISHCVMFLVRISVYWYMGDIRMAVFRFRVTSIQGWMAGFRDAEVAKEFASYWSAKTGAFCFVTEHPHGKGDAGVREIAWFLRGKPVTT